jgi:hypothetical protein
MQDAETHAKGEQKIHGPFLGLLLVPLMFLAAAISIPYGVVANALYEKRARHFARKMAEKRRSIASDQLLNIEAKNGTIIWEWKSQFKGPTRVWWTADNLLQNSPFPIVDRKEWVPQENDLPFTRWCFNEYVDPSQGKALLLASAKEQKRIVREKFGDIRQIDVLTLTTDGW